jgi:putative endonuclease
MAFLYVLQSVTTEKFYIGSTVDLPARFAQHQLGRSSYTRGRGPRMLVYQEEYPTLAEARRRERQLKSWKSHRMIQTSLIVETVRASRLAGKVDGSSLARLAAGPFGPTINVIENCLAIPGFCRENQ